MFFSKILPKNELVLLVDVGSSSVGAALVIESDNGFQTVVASRRNDILFQDEISFSRFFDSMLMTLALSVNETISSISKRPDKIICFLASPWYASQIRTVKYQKEKNFEFTKAIFDNLILEEIKRFQQSEIAKLRNTKAEIVLIENKVIDVKSNGYREKEPFGKVIRNIEISLFLGMAPEKVITSIKSSLNKILPDTNTVFHSFLLPFFAVVRDLYLNVPDFILIDIGGEVSDLSVARSGVLTGVMSFPLGKNFLLRSAGEVLKKDVHEISSLISLYLTNRLEDMAMREFETALIPTRTLWLKSLHEALDSITNDLSLPNNIFLTVDSDIEKWFVATIRNEEYGQFTLTQGKFNITVVDMPVVEKYLTFSDTIDHDQFLSLEALFIKLQSTK